MGYDELVRRLIRDAEARSREIVARARDEAARVVAAAREEADALERAEREALDREAARGRAARAARAEGEARAMRLRARAALLDEALERVGQRLARLPSEEEYPRIVARLFEEILPEVPAGTVVLRSDPRGLAALERAAGDARFRIEPLSPEEIGGVEAADEGGTTLLRNTIAARFRNARPELAAAVGRELGEGDE